MTTQEPLTEPPEPEGDDSEAGGGAPANPVTEDELADADPLDDDDDSNPDDDDEPAIEADFPSS